MAAIGTIMKRTMDFDRIISGKSVRLAFDALWRTKEFLDIVRAGPPANQ
jgi:hypothetical protein